MWGVQIFEPLAFHLAEIGFSLQTEEDASYPELGDFWEDAEHLQFLCYDYGLMLVKSRALLKAMKGCRNGGKKSIVKDSDTCLLSKSCSKTSPYTIYMVLCT